MGIEGHPLDIERLFFVTATSLIIFLIGIGLLPTPTRGILGASDGGLGARAALVCLFPIGRLLKLLERLVKHC